MMESQRKQATQLELEVMFDEALTDLRFVDIHTHLDAQLAWDPDATSSCWHGVTSVVLGNCGVTFAPVRPGQHSWIAELMESVEDIPAASILEGLAWDWETYGEYLQAIDRMPKGVNVGGMIGHCAMRHYAMGERGLDEAPATDDDIAAMVDLADEAMRAGALDLIVSSSIVVNRKWPRWLVPKVSSKPSLVSPRWPASPALLMRPCSGSLRSRNAWAAARCPA